MNTQTKKNLLGFAIIFGSFMVAIIFLILFGLAFYIQIIDKIIEIGEKIKEIFYEVDIFIYLAYFCYDFEIDIYGAVLEVEWTKGNSWVRNHQL